MSGRPSRRGVSRNHVFLRVLRAVLGRPSRRGVSRNGVCTGFGVEGGGRPSRRGVSRNGVFAEKFHILTSTGALNLQLFDCKYEDVRKAAVLQTLEAIFSKH